MSSITCHALFSLLLFVFVYTVYAFHANVRWTCRLRQQLRKEKEAIDPPSSFSAASLLRLMILPVMVSVLALYFVVQAETESAPLTFAGFIDNLIHVACTFSLEETASAMKNPESADGLAFFSNLHWLEDLWISLIMAAAPLLTLGTAASFFRLPRFWMMLMSRRHILIFSEVNPRALKYAEVLKDAPHPRTKKAGKLPFIVFCTDAEKTEVPENNQMLLLNRDVTNLHIPARKLKDIHFYLVDQNESGMIAKTYQLKEKHLQKGCRIFCVSDGTLSEHAIDQLNTAPDVGTAPENSPYKNYGVDVIDEKIRVVYQNLHENALITKDFLKALGEEKEIRVLIIGAGRVGEVVARTMIWYCQLPGYKVSITLADKEKSEAILRSRVLRHNPRFEEMLTKIQPDEQLTLHFLADVDVSTDALENLLNTANPHKIYICTGDDTLNYQTALHIRRHFLREDFSWGCPEIRAVIWDDTITQLVEDKRFSALHGTAANHYDLHSKPGQHIPLNSRCDVQLLGSMKKTLLDFDQVWFDAYRYHIYYCHKNIDHPTEQKLTTENDPIFNTQHTSFVRSPKTNERSNFAVALHGKVKYAWLSLMQEQLPSDPEQAKTAKEEWFLQLARTEHDRWSIFKLLEGSAPIPDSCQTDIEKAAKVLSDYLGDDLSFTRDQDVIRGYHSCLVPWQTIKALADSKKNDPFTQYWKNVISKDEKLASFSITLENIRAGKKQ